MSPRAEWVCVDCGAEMFDGALTGGDDTECKHCTVLHDPGTPNEVAEEGRCEQDAMEAL